MLLLLELAYLALGNAFLRSSWGQDVLSRKPGRMTMEWSNGWTAFPGQLHLEDFGRRAIMAARQTLISRIMELEKDEIYKRYSERVGDIPSKE